jgi:aconitase B
LADQEYLKYHSELAKNEDSIYQYLNFDQAELGFAEAPNVSRLSESPKHG